MKFFLPDWDDRVDPGFDFQTERFSLDRAPYDDLYAHEVMTSPVYDGILVSRMALGESGPKRDRVREVGMRAYLRLPSHLQLLGDCGAFGFVRERDPVFDTADLLSYYEMLGVDLGVSLDHLIVPEFADQQVYRYNLTLRNAEEFLSLAKQHGCRFTPVGAVQGWDVNTYVEAARTAVAMGYDYIAIGGLARSNTRTVESVVRAIRMAVPPETRIHIFGIARLSLLPLFIELDIASVDSAAPLRQAWMSAHDNFYTLDRTYAAIRIPIANEERPKAGTLVNRSAVSLRRLQEAECEALSAVRAYDRGELKMRATLDAVEMYDRLLAPRLDGQTMQRRLELYRQTLRDQPWKRCRCDICRALGIEVILFRGNNRNRRRGFHNLWVVRHRIDAAGAVRVQAAPATSRSM